MSVFENNKLLQANNLFRENKHFAAIEQYKALADTHYLSEICYFNMSMSYLKEGMVTEASKAAYELSLLNPESVFSKEINLHLNNVFYVDNKGPELSIIVPVYNSGQYLEKCLSTIVNQHFKNFEVVIVNDGSTDNSAEIIARFAEQDNRFVVIENNKASGNPGTPRNQALEVCKGAYIGFVDSDDWLDSDYYSSLMEKALAGFPDIVFSNGFKNCLRTGEVSVRKYNNAGFNDPKSKRYKFHDSFMIWDKVFHRRLIKTFDIKLGETPAAVDVPFIFKAYYYCATVSYSDGLVGYNYRRESESSVTVAHRKNSNCDFEFKSYQSVIDWAVTADITGYYKHLIDMKMVNSLLYTLSLVNADHFSGFLRNVKTSFANVNENAFKLFCIDNKKWWLYKEFITVRDGKEQHVKMFLEQKKREAQEKQYKNGTQVKFSLKGDKKGILFFPAWVGDNPYQRLLYEAINRKFNVAVSGHAKEALCERFLTEQRNDFDYLHFHWLHAFLDFSATDGADHFLRILSFAKTIGYKIIYTAHNIISHDSQFIERETLFRNMAAKYFDYALVHGNKAKDILVDKINVNPEKIIKVPHGSYGDHYGQVINKEIARSEFGIDDDAVVFLFFGNIKGYKGLGNLLQAFERVYQANDKAVLIVAGRLVDPQSKVMMAQYLAHPGIKFRTGFIEDSMVKVYFSAADYTVLPFKKILTSGSAVLSLTFQCPVIAPNEGLLPEILTDGMGYLFSDFDEMSKIMLQRSLANEHVKKANLLSFNRDLAWDNCLQEIEHIFC